MAERLQKILSTHGVASRRDAETMIKDGRVTVNGIVAGIGQSAEPGRDKIAIDGEQLELAPPPVYIMLNKPRGYITTTRDEKGRKTVMSLVADVGVRVYPVGRLDYDSEGMLLFTYDGGFSNMVAHPSYNKVKTYEVIAQGDAGAAVETLSSPMVVDSQTVRAITVELVEHTVSGGVFRIGLGEGRNRQVRKMFAACGLRVLSLKRVAIGKLSLGLLEPGRWRHLTEEELRELVFVRNTESSIDDE